MRICDLLDQQQMITATLQCLVRVTSILIRVVTYQQLMKRLIHGPHWILYSLLKMFPINKYIDQFNLQCAVVMHKQVCCKCWLFDICIGNPYEYWPVSVKPYQRQFNYFCECVLQIAGMHLLDLATAITASVGSSGHWCNLRDNSRARLLRASLHLNWASLCKEWMRGSLCVHTRK